MKYLILCLLLATQIVEGVKAQDAMSTDRPDFTESALTVGQGTLQLEAGLTRQSAGDTYFLTTGEGLIRYGLRPRFELRVGLPSYLSSDVIDNGLSDLRLGFKWNMANLDNGIRAGLIAGVTLPTGDLGAEDPNPGIILVASKPLTERLSMATQVSSTLFKMADEWQNLWMATAVIGAPINNTLGAFVEIKMEKNQDMDARYVLHTGLLYTVSDDFQLDLHVGTGMNDSSGDAFIGLGFAFRR